MPCCQLTSCIPLWAIAVSLLAIPLILVSDKRPKLRETWTLLAAFIKWGLILSMLPGILDGKTYRIFLTTIIPGLENNSPLNLGLQVDAMGLYFAIVASTLWIITSFYSIGYVRGMREAHQTRYFACFSLCLSATIGIAFAANLITLLIFYEILSIATYPLVIHKGSDEAIAAGRKYLAYALSAGVILILAVLWSTTLAPVLNFQAGGYLQSGHFYSEVHEAIPLGTARFLFILFLIGFGVKAGLMPLHSWLPSAMVAPTPVSALLHAVAVVKAGVFAILRIVGFVFGPHYLDEIGGLTILAVMASTTILLASLLAFRQTQLKKRLAYSTIAHLSYILLGVALLGVSAWQGSLLHLANHATLKITLFFVAGAIYVTTKKDRIDQLDGIGRTMPITMTAFTLGSLGLAGFPLINGFISKWYLVQGALEAGEMIFFAVFLIASLLCAGYLLPIAIRAFFFKPECRGDRPVAPTLNEASPWLLIPLSITALLSVYLGVQPDGLAQLWTLSAKIANQVMEVL